jgi:DNA helicase-2/ATP-dependent DNA helicase PcrA
MSHFERIVERDLNEAQRKAALLKEGPLLIMAGAGAGKTKTLAYRILGLILGGVAPENILAITFTNKAAEEMKERVARLLHEEGSGYSGSPFIGTFHALGVSVLRQYHQEAGLSRYFSILDRSDAEGAVKEALRRSGYEPKEFEPRKILAAISRRKNGLGELGDSGEGSNFFENIVSQVQSEYQKILAEKKALDFDDLIIRPLKLFENHPAILDNLQKRFQYIHVDEYQDTNTAQYEFVRLLAKSHKNICVVGDSDQSIYGWRGADFNNILNFEKEYPGAAIVLLEENYRSTGTIIAAAQSVIEKNLLRKEKKLFTKNKKGDLIIIYAAKDGEDEAIFVSQKIKEGLRKGVRANEMAVLYRANFQSRAFEEQFLRQNIDYQVIGTRFFERREVKDIISYLRAALYPDDHASLLRIANVPPRGLGKVALAHIASGQADLLPRKARESFESVLSALSHIKEMSQTISTSHVVRLAVQKSGLLEHLSQGKDEDLERLENIKELIALSQKYDSFHPEEGIERLLTEAALLSDQDNLNHTSGGVKLLTAHSAKGLEFDCVFVVGLEAGLFPHKKPEESDASTEEERRLFYVAITRARKNLCLSFAKERVIYGGRDARSPSPFLSEIDPGLIEYIEKESSGTVVYLD